MSTPAATPSGGSIPGDDCIERVEREQRAWREQWLAFPTVGELEDGSLEYWAVEPDTRVYSEDWPRGERLADETIAHMQRFPEGSTVLRRILARIDHESTVAQGFLSRIEDALSRPGMFLPSLGSGPREH